MTPADPRNSPTGSTPAATAGGRPGGFKPLDLGALLFASTAIGVAVTSIMQDVGTSGWVIMAGCMFAFSGTGEVAYASVIATGGGMTPALVAAMLVSSRFGLLAMSMTGRWKAPWWERIGVAHFASEVAVAAAIDNAPNGERAARRAFWQLALCTSAGWVIGSALGLGLGDIVGDTKRIGLDAVFPASFVGAVVNGLRRQDSAVAVVLGAVAAMALTPVLPSGVPVLIAAGASLVALAAPSRPWGSKQ